ncbi:hypothetical protein N7491_011251 [Penicillium cf. griseofulvum]|nr:hypothetical protein N7491_011251 [Penicillium cf. griseofulvum]
MTPPWINPIRIVQALFGVIVIGLTGYVVSTYYDGWSYSDTVNFLVFLGCWTAAFIAVPSPRHFTNMVPRLAHQYVIPAVEVITMIFGLLDLSLWERCCLR